MYCNLENLQKIPMKKLAFGKYHDNKRLNLIHSVRSFLSFQNYSQCLFPSVSCDKDFWSSQKQILLEFHCFGERSSNRLTLFWNYSFQNKILPEAAVRCCSVKKCSQKFRKIRRKAPVSDSFCRPQACSFIEKETLKLTFSANFAKYLRTPFSIENFMWLFLFNS